MTSESRIHALARTNNTAAIEDMLDSSPSLLIDERDSDGRTLLHVACSDGHKNLAKLCLRRGADINAQTTDGQTPLHFAFSAAHTTLAQWLISKGADDALLNAEGLTPYEGIALHESGRGPERVGFFTRAGKPR